MRRTLITLASVVLTCTGLAVVLTASPAQADNHQITICHATGADGHYTSPSVPKQQIFNDNGHGDGGGVHPGDIIPPFAAGEHGGQSWGDFAGQNWDAEGQAIYNNGCAAVVECPDGDFNGPEPGCGSAPAECPGGDFNGDEPGCGEPPPVCPDGDFNGDEPGCGTPPPPPPAECPDGDLNGDEPGCGTVGGVVDPDPDGDVGGVVRTTEVEHRFRCGEAIRIERVYENGELADVDRTVTPTGENCSPAERRIPAAVWAREHVQETGL